MTLKDLKFGDVVVYNSNDAYHISKIVKVERITNTQIIAMGLKFRKSNGTIISDKKWSTASIHVPETGEIEEIQQYNLIQNAIKKCNRVKEMSPAMAQEILKIFKKYEKDG